MVNQELLNYFMDNGKGSHTWLELAIKFNYRPELNPEQRADSIRKKLSKFEKARDGASIKSIWKTGENYNVSYRIDEDINWSDLKRDVLKYVKDQDRERAKVYIGSTFPKLCVISDLHIGALVKESKNGKNYDLSQAIEYLDNVAKYVNACVEQYRAVDLLLLGDIIESFTGTMHPSSWKEVEIYGADVVICAFEILRDFLLKINNLQRVRILAGNHDRMSDDKAGDSRGEIAKLVSFMLEQEGFHVNFEFLVDSFNCGDLNIVATHGHHGLVKNPERMILNYGDVDKFNLLLSGHLHTRRKKSPVFHTNMAHGDTDKFVHLVCPSIFTGNFFSERLGYYTNPGFIVIDQLNKKPIITDIYL